MKKNNEAPNAENEDEFDETFSLLSRLEPALAARVRNRQVIAAELARIQRRIHPASKPWWRRSVSLPAPVAFGLCALLLAAVYTWLPRSSHTRNDSAVSSNRVEPSDRIAEVSAPSGKSMLDGQPTLNFRATETYLCGVGRLSHQTVYEFQDR